MYGAKLNTEMLDFPKKAQPKVEKKVKNDDFKDAIKSANKKVEKDNSDNKVDKNKDKTEISEKDNIKDDFEENMPIDEIDEVKEDILAMIMLRNNFNIMPKIISVENAETLVDNIDIVENFITNEKLSSSVDTQKLLNEVTSIESKTNEVKTNEAKLQDKNLVDIKIPEIVVKNEKSEDVKILDKKSIMINQMSEDSGTEIKIKSLTGNEHQEQAINVSISNSNEELPVINENSKVAVKLSNSATIDMGKDTAPKEIAEKIVMNINDNIKTFELNLKPEALGKVVIKIIIEEGRASVEMICSDPKARNLLAMQSEQIRAIVQSNTGEITTVKCTSDDGVLNDNQNNTDSNAKGQNTDEQSKQSRHKNENDIFTQKLKLGILNLEEEV